MNWRAYIHPSWWQWYDQRQERKYWEWVATETKKNKPIPAPKWLIDSYHPALPRRNRPVDEVVAEMNWLKKERANDQIRDTSAESSGQAQESD